MEQLVAATLVGICFCFKFKLVLNSWKLLEYFPCSDSPRFLLSPIFWWADEIPDWTKNMLFYLSGSTPLQDVIQVNTYPVPRKKPDFLLPFSSHKSNLIIRNFSSASLFKCIITSVALKCSADRFSCIIRILLWLFLFKGSELLDSDAAFESCRPQKQWPSPLFQTCLNEVMRFLTASFHTESKVLWLYQCFQRGRIFANGTTSAVSCVTVASDSKPLNYYNLDRGTKEDVELFKVP